MKGIGINYFRAVAYKTRTNPNSFQRLTDEGIEFLIKIKNELNLKIVTESMTIEQLKNILSYVERIDKYKN